MSDFESRLTQMLAERADSAEPGLDLAGGARSRLRRRRVLRTSVVATAVVAAAAAVPLGLGLVEVGGEDPGVATGPDPVVSQVPADWRFESYHNVEFAVPPTWGYGSLDGWCAAGPSLAGRQPVVERPGAVVATIACPSSAYGVRVAGSAPTDPPPGAIVLDTTVGGTTVTVVAQDAEVAQTVIGSVRAIAGKDSYGCAATKQVPALGEMTGSSTIDRKDPVTLCRYDLGLDGPNLSSSERVSKPADLESFWLGLDAGQPGVGPDSGPSTCIDSPESEALLVQVGDQEVAWVHYSGCAGHGIDVHGTTLKLNEQVMYWALPRGGFGLDGSIPLPKELRP